MRKVFSAITILHENVRMLDLGRIIRTFENIRSNDLMPLSYPVSRCVQTSPDQCQNEICLLFCIWLLLLGLLLIMFGFWPGPCLSCDAASH